MKSYFVYFLICCLVLGGCSTATLDTKYSTSSWKKDYEDLSEQISAEEAQLLKDYISESISEQLIEYTYREILKVAKFVKEREMKERQREAEGKKLIQQRTELLCSKKWKLKDMEYVVERVDDSVSVYKLTKPAVKAFSKNRWKIYASDGTYQEIRGDEKIRKGSWWFVSPDEIHEARPVVYLVDVRTKTNEVYCLTIDTLDERQFRYVEELSSSNSYTSLLVTMEARE